MLFSLGSLFPVVVAGALTAAAQNQTRYNPAIPGWHSDPSCVFVPERDNTTFCTSSSFLLTPGLAVHASKDLTNWKLASHALSRRSQFPEYDQSIAQSDGIWAATIRYNKGIFYIITIYNSQISQTKYGLIFSSEDPYNDNAWSDPVRLTFKGIDPDIFWDDDGTAYVATAGTWLQTLNLKSGSLGEPRSIWNGTTGTFLEGPHIYRKDGYYYLMVAEGGSGMNHSVTIARSSNIWGPYESNPVNPVLTNRDTSEYFQNVGHADLFQDKNGNWWSAGLTWRSGPEGLTYPMGRETFLTPVTWNKGDWPIFSPVRGVYNGWSLPSSIDIPGDGAFVGDPDVIDFEPNSTLPRHLGFWKWPNREAYTISPLGHPGTLRLTPSFNSIADGATNFTAGFDLANRTLLMRIQTDTLFEYSVDVSFDPKIQGEEVGVTAYLNQVQNINLGIVMLPLNDNSNKTSKTSLAPHLRFLVSGLGSIQKNPPAPVVTPVPCSWYGNPIRLIIRAETEEQYTLYAAPKSHPEHARKLGEAPASLLSGGMGDFTGTLLGVYATTNRGNGTTPSYISSWRYQGLGQAVARGQFVPSRGQNNSSDLS